MIVLRRLFSFWKNVLELPIGFRPIHRRAGAGGLLGEPHDDLTGCGVGALGTRAPVTFSTMYGHERRAESEQLK